MFPFISETTTYSGSFLASVFRHLRLTSYDYEIFVARNLLAQGKNHVWN